MAQVRSWLLFYIESSIHVGLAVISLLGISALEFNTKLDYKLVLFVFSTTVLGYNFIRYQRGYREGNLGLPQPNWLFWLVNLMAALAAVYSTFYMDAFLLRVMIVLGLITLFYDYPLNKKRNLRNQSGLKILLVALVWTGASVYPAVHSAGLGLKGDVLLSFAQRFLLVILLTLPFEIRDLNRDESSLGTLPQVLGIPGTKKFGFILALIVVGLELSKSPYQHVHMVVLIYMVVMALGSLLAAGKDQKPLFASFWVESIPIVGYLLALSLSG